jgi:hypothetical protein
MTLSADGGTDDGTGYPATEMSELIEAKTGNIRGMNRD